MDEKLAAALGALVWWGDVGLKLKPVDPTHCSVMELPRDFGEGEYVENLVLGQLPCRPAIFGELLVMHDHLLESDALRALVRVFLRAAFDPIIVGSGKACVFWDSPYEGIVFLPQDLQRWTDAGRQVMAQRLREGYQR